MKTPAKPPPASSRPVSHHREPAASRGNDKPWSRWYRTFQAPLFFTLFFICLWRWVDVGLIYHGGGEVRGFPSFDWGWDFARGFLDYPGGLAHYVSGLLAQSLCYSAFGALVLTLQAWLGLHAVQASLRKLGAGQWVLPAFALPLLLVAVYSRYGHYSSAITTLVMACAAGWLSLAVAPARLPVRLGLMIVVGALLDWAAPAGLLVYLLAVAAAEWRMWNCWAGAALALAILAALPYLEGTLVFGLGASEAFQQLLPFPWDWSLVPRTDALILAAVYLVPPLLWISWIVWKSRLGSSWARHLPKTSVAASQAPSSTSEADARPRAVSTGRFLLETGGLGLALIGVVVLSHDPRLRAALAADCFAWHGAWKEALNATEGDPHRAYVASLRAQALYHTGGLMHELPLLRKGDDLVLATETQAASWRKADIYYDLGYANMALHYLTESVEFWGERPILLRRLALVNFALGNTATGNIFLKALRQVPFHGDWAKDCLARLQNDPALEQDEEVSRLRRRMLKRDSVVRATADEELLNLLAADPANRMAFEYLMTYYLIEKNLAGFVRNLSRAQAFAGFEVSPLWQEALAVAVKVSSPPPDLKGRALDPNAVSRVEAMLEVLRAYGGNRDQAKPKLREHYAESYFYYYLYRR